MVAVGTLFVVNSLDLLMRLYTRNIGITAERLGTIKYVFGNWTILFGLVPLYQFTPLQIEWFGLAVIGIYAAMYVVIARNRATLARPAG